MRSTFPVFLLLFCCAGTATAQVKIAEMEATNGFSKANEAAGYILNNNTGYHINLQISNTITRNKYDASFKLTGTYKQETREYTFNTGFPGTPVFVTDLQVGSTIYEVYADKKHILVIQPDFGAKRDSVVYSLDLKEQEDNQKRLAVMPYAKGIRILGFSNKADKLFVYDWRGIDQVDTIEFALPESSLSPEEIKTYSKSARVKYKPAFSNLVISRTNVPSMITTSGTDYVYYDDQKIWLVLQTPIATGYHVLELDPATGLSKGSNFMINDMRKNAEAKPEIMRTPYALIWNNHLVIRNSNNYSFQYLFYNLTTKELVKEYKADDESLPYLVHSDMNQRGTWLSGGDEKKLDNEKAYLRKLSSGEGFLFLSQEGNDSITITTGSLKKTEGLAGSLLTLGQMFFPVATFMISNFQITFYLRIYRNKMMYSHSRFSKTGFQPATSKNVLTPLDHLLDNFERRDLKSNSSFIFSENGRYSIGVFDPGSKKFEIFKLGDE